MGTTTVSRGEAGLGAMNIDSDLLRRIDGLKLNERTVRWKEARQNATTIVCVERQRLAMESWKETEGEDIEIRRAKLLKKILEGVPISILDFDLIVGRVSKYLLSASTSIDICGDYIPGLWDDGAELNLNLTVKGAISREDREMLRECTKYFSKETPGYHVEEAWRNVVGTWAEDAEEARLKDPKQNAGFLPGATETVMWDKVLAKGLRGIIEEAEAGIKRFMNREVAGIDKFYFWKAVVIACEAAIEYAHRYARLARRMAETEPNPARRSELLEIAGVCEWVPEHPARTFREAIQSVHLAGLVKNLEHPATFYPTIARADQYLWPYFEKDFYGGRLTLESAAELLECGIGHWGSQAFVANAVFRESHQINFGINQLSVGGVDKDGRDASNLLSYLLLHIVGLLKLSVPTVSFQWNRNTPGWLLDKAIATNISTKGGIPLFENGDYVTDYFVQQQGIPVEQARDWYGLGCITPIVRGKIEHNGSEGLGAVNIACILDVTLHNGLSSITGKRVGLETGDPRNFKTFEELYDAFKKQCDFIVTRTLWLASIARDENQKYMRLPFLSSIASEGCMENGKDTVVPDPSYHSFCTNDRAIIDTSDSLFAVRKLVFEENKLTMSELMGALDSNFDGKRGGQVRQMCLAAPKFGNGIDEADLMARDVGSFSGNVILSYDNRPYAPVRTAREGLSWHYYGGLGVGALPNGRKAKEPLNDGSFSPMRGMDKCGPTGVLRSVLKAGFKESCATALNQKFSASTMQGPESRKKLAQLTETFFKQGGQHIQYNLVDAKELLDAKAHPEDHRDLIVRVGGFSAYFVQLSPEIQDDVINRTQQEL